MGQKTFWRIVLRWIDRDYYLFTTGTFLISILIFYHSFTKDKFSNDSDLTKVSGKLIDYSFTHGSRGTKMYYLWLENYQCTFQIPADYLSIFKKEQFRIEIKNGDTIEIMVPTNRLENFQTDSKVVILGLSKGETIYLEKEETIAKERNNSDRYVGLGFFLAGLIYLIIRLFYWTPKRARY